MYKISICKSLVTWDAFDDKLRGYEKVNYQRVWRSYPNINSKPEDSKKEIQPNYLICSEKKKTHVWVNLTKSKQI